MKKLYTALVLTLFVLPLFAQNIPSYVPKEGLVGYWPFNGNANDESGNGNHGTVNGATLTADRNGVANTAYSFDGNQWIEVNNNINHNVGSGSFTLSCWSLKKGNNDFDHLIARNQANSNKDYVSSYNLRYQFGTIAIAGSSSAIENLNNGGCETIKINDLNNWNYIVAVFDSLSSTYSIYVNGKLNTNCKITNKIYSINNNGKIYFGVENPTANLESGPLFMNGYIDDIAIYNRALSEHEITALYTGNPIAQNIPSYVPKDGLVGYWPFNGNANDESGNGNHGTVNGATLTTDRYGVANSAYSFDGVDDGIEINNSVFSNNNSLSYTVNFWCMLKTKVLTNNGYTIFDDCDSLQWYGKGRFIVNSNYFKNSNFHFREDNNIAKDTVLINTWINYTCVLNAKKSKLYLYTNSKLIDSATYNSNYYKSGNRKLQIGRCQSPGKYNSINFFTSFWNGFIDDITIYNRALSEQEVKQLYEGCTKETATSSSFNALMYTTNAPVNLTASPTGGTFSGNGVTNDTFNPAKAKLGKNTVKYTFKNTTGCADSTDFAMLVVDTVGATCTKIDTVKVTKMDTITVTNNVTKYDTVKVTKFDTVTVKNNIYDTITIKNIINDTVKVTKYDTITITNNVTKYDTVIVNKTNYDTVSILKIKFKLTTGIHANQLSSLSIYPNPTSDVLHIDVSDVKALEGYRYRILDALGKEVYNQLVTQTTTEIPLKTLGAAGMYQFEILDAKNASIQSNKIVLQ